MSDGVQDNFDSISDTDDNGPTSLQGQQDEQLQAVNAAEKTIDQDTDDIIANYIKWSTNAHDKIAMHYIDDTDRQEIQ